MGSSSTAWQMGAFKAKEAGKGKGEHKNKRTKLLLNAVNQFQLKIWNELT